DPDRHRAGPRARRAPGDDRRPLARADPDLDLRPRPGGADADPLGAHPLPRRGRRAPAAAALPGARLPAARRMTPAPASVKLTIDGREVPVEPGTTIFDAARRLGIDIPTLCHAQHQTPVGVCRVCTVEVKNNRVLAAACVRPAEEGMVVATASDSVRRARRTLAELLLADHPSA